MKFAKHMYFAVTPEWRDKYVRYKKLKKLIKEAAEQVRSRALELNDDEVARENDEDWNGVHAEATINVVTMDAEVEFWRIIAQDLNMVSSFYVLRVREALQQLGSLIVQTRDVFQLQMVDQSVVPMPVSLLHGYSPLDKPTKMERDLESSGLRVPIHLHGEIPNLPELQAPVDAVFTRSISEITEDSTYSPRRSEPMLYPRTASGLHSARPQRAAIYSMQGSTDRGIVVVPAGSSDVSAARSSVDIMIGGTPYKRSDRQRLVATDGQFVMSDVRAFIDRFTASTLTPSFALAVLQRRRRTSDAVGATGSASGGSNTSHAGGARRQHHYRHHMRASSTGMRGSPDRGSRDHRGHGSTASVQEGTSAVAAAAASASAAAAEVGVGEAVAAAAAESGSAVSPVASPATASSTETATPRSTDVEARGSPPLASPQASPLPPPPGSSQPSQSAATTTEPSDQGDSGAGSTMGRSARTPMTLATLDAAEMVTEITFMDEKTRSQLLQAYAEYYRGLWLIREYCAVNVDAVLKALKKHDKYVGTVTKSAFIEQHLVLREWYAASLVDDLIAETEDLVAHAFYDGAHSEAMGVLRVKSQQRDTLKQFNYDWNTFRTGIFSGVLACMAALAVYLTLFYRQSSPLAVLPKFEEVAVTFRASGLPIIMVWLWGIDMYMWTTYRVNYVFIFDLNARAHVKYKHIFEAAAIFSALWMLAVLMYLLAGHGLLPGVSPRASPVFSLVFFIISIMTGLFYLRRGGSWLPRTIGAVMAAPFVYVEFRHFFMADQLTSLAITLTDIQHTLCFFLTPDWYDPDSHICLGRQVSVSSREPGVNQTFGYVLVLLPLFWRFLQCLRRYRDVRVTLPDGSECSDPWQLANAGKYTCGILAGALSSVSAARPGAGWFSAWLSTVVLASAYAYLWDTVKDWGFLSQRFGDRFPLLRAKLIYNPHSLYYFALVANLSLRLVWTLTLTPVVNDLAGLSLGVAFAVRTCFAVLEVCRRTMWNLFRLENEQLHNTGKFRATNVDVPLLELDADVIEDLLDHAGEDTEHQVVHAAVSPSRKASKASAPPSR